MAPYAGVAWVIVRKPPCSTLSHELNRPRKNLGPLKDGGSRVSEEKLKGFHTPLPSPPLSPSLKGWGTERPTWPPFTAETTSCAAQGFGWSRVRGVRMESFSQDGAGDPSMRPVFASRCGPRSREICLEWFSMVDPGLGGRSGGAERVGRRIPHAPEEEPTGEAQLGAELGGLLRLAPPFFSGFHHSQRGEGYQDT